MRLLALAILLSTSIPAAALTDAEDKIVGDCHYEFGPRTKAAERCVYARVEAMNRMIDRRDVGMSKAQTNIVIGCMGAFRSINTSDWVKVEQCYKRKARAK